VYTVVDIQSRRHTGLSAANAASCWTCLTGSTGTTGSQASRWPTRPPSRTPTPEPSRHGPSRRRIPLNGRPRRRAAPA